MPAAVDDLLHEPSGERFWGEHYLFWGQDESRSAAFMMHFARMPFDTSLHRGLLLGFLPNDQLLLVKHIGRLRSSAGPGNEAIWAECVEPFKEWVVHVDGVGRLVDRKALLTRCLPDGQFIPVKMTVRFNAVAQPWEVQRGNLTGQKWASLRFEQGCAIAGELSYGTPSDPCSVAHPLNGYGYRDHSVGVRHEATPRETTWITGVFPQSGGTLGLLKIGGDTPWFKGYVATRDSVREIMPRQVPPWTGSDVIGETYSAQFDLDGRPQSIRGEILHAAPQMNAAPNQIVMGMDQSGVLRERLVLDSPARIWWGDEEGYGYDQRTGLWGRW